MTLTYEQLQIQNDIKKKRRKNYGKTHYFMEN